jgi:ribosomal protein S18 acetylase RimI-like enzyme
MQVRPYQESDEQAVIALWDESLPADAPHNDPATAICKKLEVQRNLFLVAETSGVIVGTAMGGYDGHRGWIYTVEVKPQFRHQGIGSALLRCLEAALADLGCLKVNLQVLTTNAEVIAFYQKLGYRVEERISMGKRLYAEGRWWRTQSTPVLAQFVRHLASD